MAAGTANSIADFVRLFADLSGESMSYKPFHDRLSVVGFPEFLRESLASLMTELAAPIVASRAPFLKDFKDNHRARR